LGYAQKAAVGGVPKTRNGWPEMRPPRREKLDLGTRHRKGWEGVNKRSGRPKKKILKTGGEPVGNSKSKPDPPGS